MTANGKHVEPADLQALGLTERESKVYLALVIKGAALAAELPALAAIPRAKVYETLTRLLNLGLLVEKPAGQRKRYEAVRPDIAIDHLLRQQTAVFEDRRKLGHEVTKRLVAVYESSQGEMNPYDYFTAMRNSQQIIQTWERLQREATNEVLVFNKAPYILPMSLNVLQLEAMRRGVVFRGIYEAAEAMDDAVLDSIMSYVEAGEIARVHPHLALKLAVIDRAACLFQLMDPNFPQHESTLLIEHPGMAEALRQCFEKTWLESIDIQEFIRQRKSA